MSMNIKIIFAYKFIKNHFKTIWKPCHSEFDKNNLVIFDIKPDGVRITANSEMGNVDEVVPAEIEGKELKIAMNGKFISEALKALDEEYVKVSFNKEISPFTVENIEEKHGSYLILPVRTNSWWKKRYNY